MNAYGIAWLVIGGSALAGAAVLYLLLRKLKRPLLRAMIISLTLTFFLIPAPVPNYEAQLAPAFVVLIFETFFQIDGAPAVSMRILGLGLGAAALLTWLAHYLLARGRAVSPP